MGTRADRDRRPAKTVDKYLAAVPSEPRDVLDHLRAKIMTAATVAEKMIRFGMQAYTYHEPLHYFGAFMNHLSLFAASM